MAELSPDQKTGLNWLKQAEYDLRSAKVQFENEFWSTTCFMAQQVAEKTLKGFIIYKTGNLRKIHKLLVLAQECEKIDQNFKKYRESLELLDQYYASTRYTDLAIGDTLPYEQYDKVMAKEALDIAEQIYQSVIGQIG